LTGILKTFVKYFYLVSRVSGQVLILFMTLLITVDVLGRATLGKSTLIATELSGYTLVAVVFLGLAYTLKMGRHISVEIITSRLPERKRMQLETAIYILGAIFMAWLTWTTWEPVIRNLQTHSITTLQTPMWIPYLFIPVGSGMLTLAFLIEVVGKIRALKGSQER